MSEDQKPKKPADLKATDLDSLVDHYATPPYLIMAGLWVVGATVYYPLLFSGYYRFLNDLGGPILAIPSMYVLGVIPLILFGFCLMLVNKEKHMAGRILAIAPAIIALMTFQGMMMGITGKDTMKAKRDYFETRSEGDAPDVPYDPAQYE